MAACVQVQVAAAAMPRRRRVALRRRAAARRAVARHGLLQVDLLAALARVAAAAAVAARVVEAVAAAEPSGGVSRQQRRKGSQGGKLSGRPAPCVYWSDVPLRGCEPIRHARSCRHPCQRMGGFILGGYWRLRALNPISFQLPLRQPRPAGAKLTRSAQRAAIWSPPIFRPRAPAHRRAGCACSGADARN